MNNEVRASPKPLGASLKEIIIVSFNHFHQKSLVMQDGSVEDLEKSVGCLLIKSPWVHVADLVSFG